MKPIIVSRRLYFSVSLCAAQRSPQTGVVFISYVWAKRTSAEIFRWYLRNYYRLHSEGMGKILFSQVSVCLSRRMVLPSGWPRVPLPPCVMGGGGYPYPSQSGYPILPIGGTPFPGLDGGYPIPRSRWGYPVPRSGWGTPSQVRTGVPLMQTWVGGYPRPDVGTGQGGTPNRNSIACTCNAAGGGMPLGFTQEDFLVIFYFLLLFARVGDRRISLKTRFRACNVYFMRSLPLFVVKQFRNSFD